MRANPGGLIPPAETVGRGRLIQQLWRTLEGRSVLLTAERRIGKTCVLKKMVAEPIPQVAAAYQDLEAVRTPLEFAEIVRAQAERLGMAGRAKGWLRRQYAHMQGAEIKGLRFPLQGDPPWKQLLADTLARVDARRERLTVFAWDEIPLMLYNVREYQGAPIAMQVLDALRAMRHQHGSVRMLLTGSVGLHNLVAALRREGYANDPTSDMASVEVPPLSAAAARGLAAELLAGERIEVSDVDAVAERIAAGVDGIPYFVHHVVGTMAGEGGRWDEERVSATIEQCLDATHDPWHLAHYRKRIDTYYEPEIRELALGFLDFLAIESVALPFSELFGRVKSVVVTEDRELALDVLGLLHADHYVTRDEAGNHRFRFDLVRRWWRRHRELA